MNLLPKSSRLSSAITGLTLSLAVSFSAVSQADTLQELYQQISKDISSEASHNSEREQRFRAAAGEQKKMLSDVNAQLAEQEKLRAQLKTEFDNNEVSLAELSTQLDRRTGNLGELFGVFRQIAGDTQQVMFDSVITVEFPDRTAQIGTLAKAKEVPTIAEMQQLWGLMLQEISESAAVSRFDAKVVKPSGETYDAAVTRVGTFNIVTGDKYLSYASDSQQLVELSRQPAGYIQDTAADISSTAGEVNFAIDPSRGALLGLLVQSPSLFERVQQGKEVGYAIIAVGIVGMLIVLMRFLSLSAVSRRMKRQLKDMNHPSDDNPLGRMMIAFYENKHLNDLDVISKKLDEVVFKDITDMRKGLSTIKVMAAIAPLMGLLGTVTGMIGTFQAITLFGTGDPKLMAGGISQALITTVEGLCAAIPLLLASNLLTSKNQQLSKVIGEQASGMVAQKAAEIASQKS
ncbi:MAG: MotA/TolQ/ExbB proton channel family protein [Thalassolituus oleivorans]|uniref:MotA/TolQ/ExbB proton channel family protein n=1 Tax=Thalassolituus oleivorans TaxID=187493 RepID=UPI001B47D27C|nr:MotA/TolQ/ExbB proton channel family protein [Thalassolituus oleivorans]MBQ0726787.1 MotA/TolQ/ExbB proton channel family protein [Thalassolituus oleivorans]MBQ0781280.1 MotA/TolQ/ExbB proton channel family protein [Thalassolituus oleivorans]